MLLFQEESIHDSLLFGIVISLPLSSRSDAHVPLLEMSLSVDHRLIRVNECDMHADDGGGWITGRKIS